MCWIIYGLFIQLAKRLDNMHMLYWQIPLIHTYIMHAYLFMFTVSHLHKIAVYSAEMDLNQFPVELTQRIFERLTVSAGFWILANYTHYLLIRHLGIAQIFGMTSLTRARLTLSAVHTDKPILRILLLLLLFYDSAKSLTTL